MPIESPSFGVNDVLKEKSGHKKSVEIRTSYPFHAERPSHCPMMSNEQRETHADDFYRALLFSPGGALLGEEAGRGKRSLIKNIP